MSSKTTIHFVSRWLTDLPDNYQPQSVSVFRFDSSLPIHDIVTTFGRRCTYTREMSAETKYAYFRLADSRRGKIGISHRSRKKERHFAYCVC